MPKKVLAGCRIMFLGQNPSWSRDRQNKQVPNWLRHLSAQVDSTLSTSTTHLVVSSKRWYERPRSNVLETAMRMVADGSDLKIVSFDWVDDCVNSSNKKREGIYLWEKVDAGERIKEAKAARIKEKEAAKTVPGLLAEVFEESTRDHADPVEARKMAKRLQREGEERRVQEAEAKEEEKQRRKREQAKLFGKGAKKARNEIFSDNHHIYMDATGFKFDVLLTKIDFRCNKNERWALTLQIYESNSEPHTYATNAQWSGTKECPANNITAAAGSPLPTAMHAFKSGFFDFTKTVWDRRISGFLQRAKDNKREMGIGTGSEIRGSERGVAVSESAAADIPFKDRPFEYHPRFPGPQGELVEEERERLKKMNFHINEGTNTRVERRPTVEVDVNDTAHFRQAVEQWMAETPDGGAGEERQDSPLLGATQPDGAEIDFEAMLKANENPAEVIGQIDDYLNEYPFEKSNSELEAAVPETTAPETTAPETTAPEADESEQVANPTSAAAAVPGGNTDVDMPDLDFNIVDSTQSFVDENAEFFNSLDPIPGTEVYTQDLPFENAEQHPSFPTQVATGDPSFEPANEDSFRHGPQEIGETQIAEKIGGEFLEEFVDVPAPAETTNRTPTPTRKPMGSLNLGSSILGKRKDAAGDGEVAQQEKSGSKSGSKSPKVAEEVVAIDD